MRRIKSFKLRYLIGGAWCSGTRYIASLLSANGFLCGHERIFYDSSADLWDTQNDGFPAEEMQANSSYTTHEWFENEPLKGLPVILLVRHPVDLINSRISLDFTFGRPVDPSKLISEVIVNYRKLLKSGRVVRVHDINKPVKPLLDSLSVFESTPCFDFNRHNNGKVRLTEQNLLHYNGFDTLKAIHSEITSS